MQIVPLPILAVSAALYGSINIIESSTYLISYLYRVKDSIL